MLILYRPLGCLVVGLAVVFGSVHAMAKDKEVAKGFRLGKDVNSVVVTRYEKISDSRDNPGKKKVSVIRKAETVSRLVALINSLPPTGSAMIKMGDVEMIQAEFHGHYDTPPVSVFLYHGWVQAPDTSFYEGLPQEKEIHEILSKAKPKPNVGLRIVQATSVRVEEYDHAFYENGQFNPNRSVVIQDAETVGSLVKLVNRLPLKGEMFVSFTAYVSATRVFFVDKKGDETLVLFYDGGVSTTDGSFYVEEPGTGLQKKIWAILQTELSRTAPARQYAFEAENAQSVSLEFRKKLSDQATKWITVTDPKVIRKIQKALSKLPTEGDRMKSWAEETELLTAVFSRPGRPKTYIEFYDGHIKTPATNFYASGTNPEGALYKLIKAQIKE